MPHTVHGQASNITQSWNGVTSNSAVQGGINVAGGTDTDQGDNIIGVIKNLINYLLGFLGLIALVMLLYAGFQLVTARDDAEKYNVALGTFKNAALGIGVIGISWFLVTFIFFVFGLITN